MFRIKFTKKIGRKKELSLEKNEESSNSNEVRDAQTIGLC